MKVPIPQDGEYWVCVTPNSSPRPTVAVYVDEGRCLRAYACQDEDGYPAKRVRHLRRVELEG